MHNLDFLSTEIENTMNNQQDIIAVIFDKESVYHTTWKPIILNNLKRIRNIWKYG